MTDFDIMASIVLFIIISLGFGIEYLNRKETKNKHKLA